VKGFGVRQTPNQCLELTAREKTTLAEQTTNQETCEDDGMCQLV